MNWSGYLFAALLATAPLASAQTPAITYPGTEPDDLRTNYYVRVLDLALRKSGGPYRLQPAGQAMVSPRVMQQMEAGGPIDVSWWPTRPELERRLLPVRIPIDKGVLGWRLLLIKKSDRARFAQIHSRQQLQTVAAGLQRDWADTAILRANGLRVVPAALYRPMFQMLASDRFQYFPRSVIEVWDEERKHADLDLEVEPHLALHYPVRTYFFVSRSNPALAQRIERGLRIAIRDGSFDVLFERCNGEYIKRARLGSRTVLELRDPVSDGELPPAKPGGLHLSTAPLVSDD
jgi:hypothetical protein